MLLRVIVSGEKAQQQVTYEYEMVVRKDMTNNETAMARATANTISVVAQMIGDGAITERGVFAPETIVPGETLYLKKWRSAVLSLKKHHISLQ
ncbi:Lysine 6-dehydrogenase OS=Lysinibacillus sphaericus OX=1421 GN=lysDH PE=4 SV=1 [Lysinibacillus sphaericus]